MTHSRDRRSANGCWGALSGAALVAIAAGCSSDNTPVVSTPVDASAGAGGTTDGAVHTGGTTSSGGTAGAGGTAGSGGTAGAGGTAGSGGTAGAAGSDGAAEAGAQAHVKTTMTKLVSDQAGAANLDANLVNAWGLAIKPDAPTGPVFWVSDNGTGLATAYDETGKALPAVKVIVPGPLDGGGGGTPTGQAYNPAQAPKGDAAQAFKGDAFIFATEDGTISGWQAGPAAVVRADASASGAVYKGLAIIDDGTTTTLAATDFHNGKVDVYDANYATVKTTGFTDVNIPAGFAPFGIAVVKGKVYVTYAKQDADKKDDVKGVGNGYVDMFKPDGSSGTRLISAGTLNSPWALTIAPSSFGALSGALLVGNFGDGMIHAYDAASGAPMGDLVDSSGKPIVIDGLWALEPGPKTSKIDLSGTLFFTAGPNDEAHGLFGKLVPAK